MSERSFTIEKAEVGNPGGRFIGSSPFAVAAKAARSLFNDAKTDKEKKKKEIKFTIRETTMGSSGKEYHYIGMKKTYDSPIKVMRGDTEVTIKHVYHVKSCKP
jgi:hypothetical protein